MKSMKTLLSLVLIVLFSNCLVAQNPKMVKDFWPGSGNGWPQCVKDFNGVLFFTAFDGTNGLQELWRSDGSESGTYKVKSVNTGAIYVFDNVMYFNGNDFSKGWEPWKSNGTASGTVMIKDIKRSSSSSPAFWIKSGNTIFFNPNMDDTDWQLWKTNGTEAGTVVVKTINKRGNDAVSHFHDVNGTLFFWADNGSTGIELWKSNGTDAGTVMIREINPGTAGAYYDIFPEPYANYKPPATQSKEVNANGIYYFLAYEPNKGAELWKSDGTMNGTVRVTDINPNSGNSIPHFLTVMGDYLYFSATDGNTGYELWKASLIDGTYSQVLDINSNGDSYPMQLTVVNNVLYFSADNGSNGRELWKYDGINNPVAVTTLNGDNDGINPVVSFKIMTTWTGHWSFPTIGSLIFFEGNDGADGWELFKYDASTGTCGQVANINSSGNADIMWPEFVGGKLFFRANNGTNGYELWVYDPASPRIGFYDNEEAIVTDNYKIMVYPNPADENIMISGSFNDKVNVEIRLLDMLGKELISQNLTGVSMLSESMSLYGLAPGVYFVEMRFGSQTVQRKIIKR